MKKRIVLVTDLFTPNTTRSSTQMLTLSIIYALNKMDCDLFVIGIYDSKSDKIKISEFLSSEGVEFELFPSSINIENNNKLKNYSLLLKEMLDKNFVVPKAIKKFNKTIDRIICMVPSIEAAYYAMAIKKVAKKSDLFSVWTDVLAYNCLDDAKYFKLKRLPYLVIERRILKQSSRIFYLGEVQMNFQKKVYKKFANRMNYYYPSFSPYFPIAPLENKTSLCRVTYFGNMSSKIRNVMPLIETSKYMPNCFFSIIGSLGPDIDFSSPNLKYINSNIDKIDSLEAASLIENDVDISICFLNKHGFSMPGKLFYYQNMQRHTLVIKDGPFQNEIEKCLSEFNCFEFCDNNPESIKQKISLLMVKPKTDYKEKFDPLCRYSFLVF